VSETIWIIENRAGYDHVEFSVAGTWSSESLSSPEQRKCWRTKKLKKTKEEPAIGDYSGFRGTPTIFETSTTYACVRGNARKNIEPARVPGGRYYSDRRA